MGTKMNRESYEKMVDENINRMHREMPHSLERDHIEAVLRDSIRVYYDESALTRCYIVVIRNPKGNRQAVFGVLATDAETAVSKVIGRNEGWRVEKVKEKNEPTVFRIFDDNWYEDEPNEHANRI